MYSHDLVAPIKKLDGSSFAEGIGRYFSDETDPSGNPLNYFRVDIWPINWTGEAFIIPRTRWNNGGDMPVLEPDSPVDPMGSLSIVCESWTPKEGKAIRINRNLGEVFRGFTQYGQTLIVRFHAIPANPYYYSNKGTVRIYLKEEAKASAA